MVTRQRVQENFTIGHTLDAGVQEGQDAAVGFGANEPAKALFQGKNGLGYLEFREGVAPILLQGPDAGSHDGVTGYREGQTVNNDAGKLIAGHIHALPEAGGGEEDGIRGVLEAFEKHRAWGRSLQEQGEVEPVADPLEQIVHLGITGKQAEGAALAEFQQGHNFVRGLGGKVWVAHVRHFLGEIEERLLFVMKFRGQAALLDVVQAEALADEFEASGNGERRGGENDRVEGLKKALAQDLADVNRGGREEYALVPALKPVDIILLVGLEEKRQLLAYFKAAAGNAQEFFGFLGEAGEFRLQALQGID